MPAHVELPGGGGPHRPFRVPSSSPLVYLDAAKHPLNVVMLDEEVTGQAVRISSGGGRSGASKTIAICKWERTDDQAT